MPSPHAWEGANDSVPVTPPKGYQTGIVSTPRRGLASGADPPDPVAFSLGTCAIANGTAIEMRCPWEARLYCAGGSVGDCLGWGAEAAIPR